MINIILYEISWLVALSWHNFVSMLWMEKIVMIVLMSVRFLILIDITSMTAATTTTSLSSMFSDVSSNHDNTMSKVMKSMTVTRLMMTMPMSRMKKTTLMSSHAWQHWRWWSNIFLEEEFKEDNEEYENIAEQVMFWWRQSSPNIKPFSTSTASGGDSTNSSASAILYYQVTE